MSDEVPDSAGGLPALLAEYGRLAAGLPAACPEQARRVHERLAELDVAIVCLGRLAALECAGR